MSLFREVELIDEMEQLKIPEETPTMEIKTEEDYDKPKINADIIKLLEDIVQKIVLYNSQITPKKPIKQKVLPSLPKKRKLREIVKAKKIRKLDWIKNV